MWSSSVIKHFDIIDHKSAFTSSLVVQIMPSVRSDFRLPKNFSNTFSQVSVANLHVSRIWSPPYCQRIFLVMTLNKSKIAVVYTAS